MAPRGFGDLCQEYRRVHNVGVVLAAGGDMVWSGWRGISDACEFGVRRWRARLSLFCSRQGGISALAGSMEGVRTMVYAWALFLAEF